MGLGQQDSNNDNKEWGLDYRSLWDFGAGKPEEQKIHDLGVECEWFGGRGWEKFSDEMGHTAHLSSSYLVWESPVWIIRMVSSGSQTCSSVAQSCLTLCDPMDCSTPGFPVHHQLPELTQTHVHRVGMPSNHLILCRPLLLPSIFPIIRLFSNESVLHIRWPKYWSFSLSISPSNEHSRLISFRIDWFDLLAVQRTLKNFLQHHSSTASILRCWAFFILQLSDPYMSTGKTIALTRWTLWTKSCLCFLICCLGWSFFHFKE